MDEYNEYLKTVRLHAMEETPATLLLKVQTARDFHPDAEITISMLGIPVWKYFSMLKPVRSYPVRICYADTMMLDL
jgi:hypothetical protein